jgi:hypothetical protein
MKQTASAAWERTLINHTESSTNDWKTRQMQDIDKEKLRAFEQKMHDEGADGFADGPRPWETWDESGAQSGKHVWDGKARRIYKNTPLRRSLGDRVLSGLAMIALMTMVVGIAGVYLTEEQPRTVAWTAIQPTPIPLPALHDSADRQPLPAPMMRPAPVIAEIESLPPPAAGSAPVAAKTPTATVDATGHWLIKAEHDPETANIGEPLQDPETAPVAESVATTVPAVDPEVDPGDSGSDLEIFAAPTALLLTSITTSSPADSDESGLELEPELSLEIATAPAVDSEPSTGPGSASGLAEQETGAGTEAAATVADSNLQLAAAPARDLINRGSAGDAIAVSTPPETMASTSEHAVAAVMEASAESTTADTEAAQSAAPLDAATTAHDAASESMKAMDIAKLENPTSAIAAPATTGADATRSEAPAETAAPPAGSDGEAQNMPSPPGEDSAPGKDSVAALARSEPVAAAPSPAKAAVPAGGWVLNLASYNHEAMARRKLGEFQAKGVTAEIETTMIKGRQMYRIRVTGFESSRAARASIDSLEKILGLKGVWISRR